MVLADTLSRAYRVPSETERTASKMLQGETERGVEVIKMAQYLLISEATQSQMQAETKAGYIVLELKTAIRQGWPPQKSEVAGCIHDYFPFREELTLQNGLIFKRERLIIPTALRDSMLTKLHSTHIGIQGCLRRA